MTLRPSFILLLLALSVNVSAQPQKQFLVSPSSTKPATAIVDATPADAAIRVAESAAAEKPEPTGTGAPRTANPQFRVERMPITNGAELLTIFGRLNGVPSPDLSAPEVPLITVVRDTLSDTDPDNDRLRYVWMLTYARPNLMKRIASAVPFLYQHVGNQQQASGKTPKTLIDLAKPRRQTWNR